MYYPQKERDGLTAVSDLDKQDNLTTCVLHARITKQGTVGFQRHPIF